MGVWQVKNEDVENLLRQDFRAALPLRRQCLLYLHPFALFKDASCGPPGAQEQALSYNRAMRWMLLSYIRRWVVIAATLFLGVAPAEALAAETSLFIVPAAALAIGGCLAVAVTVCTGTAYFLLRPSRR